MLYASGSIIYYNGLGENGVNSILVNFKLVDANVEIPCFTQSYMVLLVGLLAAYG